MNKKKKREKLETQARDTLVDRLRTDMIPGYEKPARSLYEKEKRERNRIRKQRETEFYGKYWL